MATSLYRGLYFAVQRARAGVTGDQIRAAGRVLELPWEQCERRAFERLSAVHGVAADRRWLEARVPVDRRDLLVPAKELAAHPPGGVRVDLRRTSGSTGTPFIFPKDREMTGWMDAAMWAVYAWHGVVPGAPHLRFWGMPLQRGRRLRKEVADRLLNRHRINAFELTPELVRAQFAAARRRKPEYAYGYPTLMRTFAQLCRNAGLDGRELGLRVVISTGELLSPAAREEISGFFGCRVVNEYGCTESGIVAMECEHATMHALPVAVWPEVLQLRPAGTVEGEVGEVVVSDLFGRVLPLVRYRLHDRGAVSERRCECGRELQSYEIASGRIDSFIVTPRGRVYDAILAYTVPAAVQRFKVWQRSETELHAQVVPAKGFSAADAAAQSRAAWEAALGGDMRFQVEAVEEIALEASGKLRYFVPLEKQPEQPEAGSGR